MAILPDIGVVLKFWYEVEQGDILEILNVFTPRAFASRHLWLKLSHALISTKLSHLWTDTKQDQRR